MQLTNSCATRERGRRVYPRLFEYFHACARAGVEPVVSFEGVDLVSPSFLDETIVRLVREQPAGLIHLRAIRDYPVQALNRLLAATGKNVVVHRDATGEYRVAAGAGA